MSYQTSPRKRGNSFSNSSCQRNFQPIRMAHISSETIGKWPKLKDFGRDRIWFDKSNDYTSFNELEYPLFGHLNVACVKSTTAITRFIQFWIIFLVAGHLHSQSLIIIIRIIIIWGTLIQVLILSLSLRPSLSELIRIRRTQINRLLKASSNKQHQINQLLINKYINVFGTRKVFSRC